MEDDYYGAVAGACSAIMRLASGEGFEAEEEEDTAAIIIAMIIIIGLTIVLIAMAKNGNGNGSGNSGGTGTGRRIYMGPTMHGGIGGGSFGGSSGGRPDKPDGPDIPEDSAVSEEARSEVAVPEADGKTLKIKDYGNNKAVQRSGNAGFRIRAV